MDEQTKQNTKDFIVHLYKDENKSPNYLDKKRCELRGYLKKGENTKPMVIKYLEWLQEQGVTNPAPVALAPAAPTPARACTNPIPDAHAELVSCTAGLIGVAMSRSCRSWVFF